MDPRDPVSAAADPGHEDDSIRISDFRLPISDFQFPPPPHFALNTSSTGICMAVAVRFNSVARPMTRSMSLYIASVMPFWRAKAVCEWMQYSHPFMIDTVR